MRTFPKLLLMVLILTVTLTKARAADPDTVSTEKVYRDYTEAYQKSTVANEKAAAEGRMSTYLILAAVVAIVVFAVRLNSKNRAFVKQHYERSLEVQHASHKLLEEIRDLLKTNRP